MAKRPQLSKLALLKPKINSIDVDGGFISIRALSASYALSLRGKDLQGAEMFEIISQSVCDENGDLLLTTEEVGQIAVATLTQIVKGVFIFNALGEKAASEAVDELKKTDVSTTTLPAS